MELSFPGINGILTYKNWIEFPSIRPYKEIAAYHDQVTQPDALDTDFLGSSGDRTLFGRGLEIPLFQKAYYSRRSVFRQLIICLFSRITVVASIGGRSRQRVFCSDLAVSLRIPSLPTTLPATVALLHCSLEQVALTLFFPHTKSSLVTNAQDNTKN